MCLIHDEYIIMLCLTKVVAVPYVYPYYYYGAQVGVVPGTATATSHQFQQQTHQQVPSYIATGNGQAVPYVYWQQRPGVYKTVALTGSASEQQQVVENSETQQTGANNQQPNAS